MKIKEKEKRRKLLEKSNPDHSKSSRAAASEKLKQLTKTGKVSLLKVSKERPEGEREDAGRALGCFSIRASELPRPSRDILLKSGLSIL